MTATDVSGSRLHQRRFVLSMRLPLPDNAIHVALKIGRCFTIFIKREMLMIELDLWVVEVRIVLPAVSRNGRVFILWFVCVLNAVIEQPVSNQALALALDY